MFTVSDLYLGTIRGPHIAYGYVEAWYNGAPQTFLGSTHLPLIDGSVTVDGATPGARRTLSASLAQQLGLWDVLAPNGTELHAYTVVQYPDQTTETVPQGVFPVDSVTRSYSADGDIRITAPDRWINIQNARFLTPRYSTFGATNRQQIITLINDVFPSLNVNDMSTSSVTVPGQIWDRDRDKAIQDLAASASLDVFFDRSGTPVIRDAPTIGTSGVWSVDASSTGVVVKADRERNRQHTYNIVVVTNQAAPQWATPFDPVFVWDNNPNSPTYAGSGSGASTVPPDPATAGPFGQRPTFYSSPLVTNQGQAEAAGRTILARVCALAAQLSLAVAPNSALDDGDTIEVLLPPDSIISSGPTELHIIDKLVIPLRPSKGTPLQIATRSNVADGGGF